MTINTVLLGPIQACVCGQHACSEFILIFFCDKRTLFHRSRLYHSRRHVIIGLLAALVMTSRGTCA